MDYLGHFQNRLSSQFSGLHTKFWADYAAVYQQQVDGINGKRFNGFLNSLPEASDCVLDASSETVSLSGAISSSMAPAAIESALKGLKPWRKGPFNYFGVTVDAEWRSDVKWDRFSHLAHDLFSGKRVLDLGCHCGYYMCRTLPYNPEYILGVDPMPLPFYQFLSYYRYVQPTNMGYLLLGIDDLLPLEEEFDTIMCMGVLYHRRDPDAALRQLKALLRPNGKIVLETLVIPGDGDDVLIPKGRYAAMPNVRQLPTVSRLLNQLSNQGFSADVIHCDRTRPSEQRPTPWSTPTSLAQFLNPDDNTLTREGYPAPMRAMVLCERQ
ncbi:MAG: tRNA 5-methoxyuridine(34)/uridine 5-oxyacetic acid(34) synthase CmoB [bacterium]|nr:tRNA 5-methoxyuridine(34)/uridine 5-oxyacetic acid(34) synthase CmoB [bacterium]